VFRILSRRLCRPFLVMPHINRSVFVPLAIAVFAITGCASGSAIVTGTKRAPIPSEQVRLYLDPPADFEVIGIVSASSDAGLTEQGSVDYAIKELKNQAANLGANGLLLVSTDTTATVVSGYSVPKKTVQGKAIFVKGQ
jgi:hypothetical protein